jgi:hypothetical protein
MENTDFPCSEPTSDAAAIAETLELCSAALALLRDNLDLVEWALCLVQSYTPRTGLLNVDRVLDQLVDGVLDLVNGTQSVDWPGVEGGGLVPAQPWSVTVVSFIADGGVQQDPAPDDCLFAADGVTKVDSGSPMWSVSYDVPQVSDGSIGVVVAAEHNWTVAWRAAYYGASPEDRMCAVAGVAGNLFHELVHVWGKVTNGGKRYGAWHGDECWDEARMAASALRWALAQRYCNWCLAYSSVEFLKSKDDESELCVQLGGPYARGNHCPTSSTTTGGGPRIPDISPPILPVEGVEVYEARAWGAEPQVILDGAYLL